jgi:aspartate/methionine/tyrosine aminotransferase
MFADRVNQIQPFRVMEVLDRAAYHESQGLKVVHFEVGEPDFDTAAPIVEAGQQALQQGKTKYTSATGIPELRQAIVRHYQQQGITIDARRVIVTSGASGGLTLLAALLLNPGDEMLITDPGYPCNEVFTRLVGGVPVTLPVKANQHFQPRAEDIAAAWSVNTAGILLASPANPTGTMLSAAALSAIGALVEQKRGFFILDEIYQGLVIDAPYSTGLAVRDDLYVLNSFSKFFGMTGWRLGWLVVPEHAVDAVTKLAQNLFISPSTPAQYAALAAFSDEAMAVHQQRAGIFAQRGQMLSAGLNAMGFSIPVHPDGAFYLYVDVSHTGMSGRDFCARLLDEYQVAVTPGEDFGEHQHERFVRFAYTTDESSIELGLQRIGNALQAWGVA